VNAAEIIPKGTLAQIILARFFNFDGEI